MHARLAVTVDYCLWVLCVHLKGKLNYTEKAGVVACWLLHCKEISVSVIIEVSTPVHNLRN